MSSRNVACAFGGAERHEEELEVDVVSTEFHLLDVL